MSCRKYAGCISTAAAQSSQREFVRLAVAGGGGAGGPGARGTTADIGNKLLAQMLKFLEGMGGG